MRKGFLAFCIVALPAAAFTQVNTVGPFTGQYSEGFETLYTGSFVPSLSIFGGQAMVNATSGNSIDVTAGWSFFYDLSPHSGNEFMGVDTNYSIVFNNPATEFGGYFATNANAPDAVITFFDASGNEIGSGLTLSAPLGTWAWSGYSYAGGIKSVTITSDNIYDGFIMADDLQLTTAPEPATMVVGVCGLLALAKRRRHNRRT